MLSKEEVKRIAGLARLGLAENEITKLQKDLSAILDYFEKLKQADVSGAEITSHSVKVENAVREDKEERQAPDVTEKLLSLAPETEKGYLKTKKVF